MGLDIYIRTIGKKEGKTFEEVLEESEPEDVGYFRKNYLVKNYFSKKYLGSDDNLVPLELSREMIQEVINYFNDSKEIIEKIYDEYFAKIQEATDNVRKSILDVLKDCAEDGDVNMSTSRSSGFVITEDIEWIVDVFTNVLNLTDFEKEHVYYLAWY